MSSADLIRIPPFTYIHILDQNTNVATVISGPSTVSTKDQERVVLPPTPMVVLPPLHYCIVQDPVQKDAAGGAKFSSAGQVLLKNGDVEVRRSEAYPEPFALYPGEALKKKPTPLPVVGQHEAFFLRALDDYTDVEGKQRACGDEWLVRGPATLVPSTDFEVVKKCQAQVIKPHHALQLKATRACTDSQGNSRRAGEEWLLRAPGAYLPSVEETVVQMVPPMVLTPTTALHLRAMNSFVDVYGKSRKAGDEWLVTSKISSTHLVDVHETVVEESEDLLVLTADQYCQVVNPVGADGKNALEEVELRKGPMTFFLLPGEYLADDIEDAHVLADDQALLLRALKALPASNGQPARRAGERWMLNGPCDFIPRPDVEVMQKRERVVLAEDDGIYVRELETGKVRTVSGKCSYMLAENEELWRKPLPVEVGSLLQQYGGQVNADRVVTCACPANAAMQVYDYKNKRARVVLGPDLVRLGADEHFTVLSLSGGKPKVPGRIQSLYLELGPDFMTDVLEVETGDHARLMMQLSYNWHFEISKEQPHRVFTVRDFVGDACKAIASRVRGTVSTYTFDQFHQESVNIIRKAVFGTDANGEVRKVFRFPSNDLVITSIDIQSIEPSDKKTSESLQKAVQLAIEITTRSQEASARQEAERYEQEAKGKLTRQRIRDDAKAEKEKQGLLELQGQSMAVQNNGQAHAEAKARAHTAMIEAQNEFDLSKLQKDAQDESKRAAHERTEKRAEAEAVHQKTLNDMEVVKAKALADVEAASFEQLVDILGRDTIVALRKAGPELRANLLRGLGVTSLTPKGGIFGTLLAAEGGRA